MNGELSVTAVDQISALFSAAAVGFVVGLFYDVFRIFRLFFEFRRNAVIIQDIIFWVLSSFIVFFSCISVNEGYVRIYYIAAVLLSWLLYFFTAGRVVMFISGTAAAAIKKLVIPLFFRVIRFIGAGITKIFMLISQIFSKILMHMTKFSKKYKKC